MSLATDLSDGIGGLKFVATAPPGVGRLCRIPFYKTNTAAEGAFTVLSPGAAPVGGSSVSPAICAAADAAGSFLKHPSSNTPNFLGNLENRWV